MQLPLSQLVYAPVQTGNGTPTIITLHWHDAFAEEMRDLGVSLNPSGRVLGLQSGKGVYIGRDITGYTWFLGPLEQPSPIHFGDALAEIERFLWDEIDRSSDTTPELPFLVGDEQGAIMALAVAAAVPDLLSGVVAINGALPIVPGWEPPLAPLDELPIMLVNPTSGDELAGTFNGWGATVTLLNAESNQLPTGQIAEWISRQPPRRLRS
jgi:pimeloyl-ACP methyl ester carboxylesterase